MAVEAKAIDPRSGGYGRPRTRWLLACVAEIAAGEVARRVEWISRMGGATGSAERTQTEDAGEQLGERR